MLEQGVCLGITSFFLDFQLERERVNVDEIRVCALIMIWIEKDRAISK